MQRLRIKYRRGEEVKYISHLDIMRLWQRALNRAGISLAYSEGFHPHPKFSLAAPLAIGVTSQTELMDITLTRQVSPHFLTAAVTRQLPAGFEILQVVSIPETLPSLQSQIRFAEYTVELTTEREQQELASAIASLLSRENLPWQHQRDTGPRHYDLRALVDDIWLLDCQGGLCKIGMRLRCDNSGSGRPEQVSIALGFTEPPISVHRTKLILSANQVAS
jgi:radical SAM-linked protein